MLFPEPAYVKFLGLKLCILLVQNIDIYANKNYNTLTMKIEIKYRRGIPRSVFARLLFSR